MAIPESRRELRVSGIGNGVTGVDCIPESRRRLRVSGIGNSEVAD